MESSSPSVPFPLLQAPVEANYRACTIPYRFPSDNPRKATPIEIQWIDLFLNSVPSFRQRAENDPTVTDAPKKAEKFAQRFEMDFWSTRSWILFTSLHAGGSIPHTEHWRRLWESLGREPTMAELHQRTHQRASNKDWVDQRLSTVHSEYMCLREQTHTSKGQTLQTSDFDTWREAAGGKKKRIYGLGSVGHGAGTSSHSAHSVDSSGSTIEMLIRRHVDPIERRYE